jgi:hypothetical protein
MLLVGGPVIAAPLLILSPAVSPDDCSNYGGNGNASAYADGRSDFLLPGVFLGWIVLIAVEQTLPVTWRGHDRVEVAVRAGFALFLAVTGSCCLYLTLATVCH